MRVAAAAALSSGSDAAPLQRVRAEEGGGRQLAERCLRGGCLCGRAAGAGRAASRCRRGAAGTQFTSFTSTNVQILTAEEQGELQVDADVALEVGLIHE